MVTSCRPYEIFALETDRLRLSVYKKSRSRQVTDYLRRNRAFHQKWAQTHDNIYFQESVQREYLKSDIRDFRKGHLFPFWITLKDDDSKVIGRISFFNVARGGMMCCSAGYHLDESVISQGYMTEALNECVKLLFEQFGFHRIEAFILPENDRSIALVKRAGFEYEGTRKSYMHINGQWRDHEAFYIINENPVNVT